MNNLFKIIDGMKFLMICFLLIYAIIDLLSDGTYVNTQAVNTINKYESNTQTSVKTPKPTITKIQIIETKKIENKEMENMNKYLLQNQLQERPLMNGLNTERIGTYARVVTSKELLTEEVLLSFEKYLKNKNFNYTLIDFQDGTGLHVNYGIYTFCKIGKDNRGIYENQGDLGKMFFVYLDENKVDWNNFK